MRCSNFRVSDYLAYRCSKCLRRYALVDSGHVRCSNVECEGSELCPGCGRGTLLLRRGRNEDFWGCLRYLAIPPLRVHARERRQRISHSGEIAR